MEYIIEKCDICNASGRRQNKPPEIKMVRNPGQESVRVACCDECGKKVDLHNKPFDDADREADEKAKAAMDAKLAAIKTEEDSKKKQEGQIMDMLVQQNAMMLQLMQQMVQQQQQNAPKPRRNRSPRQEVQPQG